MIHKLHIEEEYWKLKQVLQEMIDYHHYIGNDDCPVTVNESLTHLYKMAEDNLKSRSVKRYHVYAPENPGDAPIFKFPADRYRTHQSCVRAMEEDNRILPFSKCGYIGTEDDDGGNKHLDPMFMGTNPDDIGRACAVSLGF